MGTDTDVRVSIRDILALRSEIAELKEIILGGQTKVNEVKHAPAETEEPETTPSPTVRLCGAPIGSSTANGVHKTCQQPAKYDEDGKLASESGKPPIHCGKHRKNKPPRKDKGTARLHKSEEGVPRPVTPQTDDPIPPPPRLPLVPGPREVSYTMIEAGGSPLPLIDPIPPAPRFHSPPPFDFDPPIGVFEKVRKAEDQVAFWTACYDGDEYSVHRLIGRVDVNKGFKEGDSGVDVVRAFIKEGKMGLIKAGYDGWTPLHTAVEKGRLGVVRALLDTEKVIVDAVFDDYGAAPLHLSAYKGYADIARALLDAGADTTKTIKSNDTYDGLTAREIAAEQGHERIVRMFDETEKSRKTGKDQTEFWTACHDGDVNSVHRLIGKVDVHKTHCGETHLRIAVSRGHVDIVHALINANVDLDKTRVYKGRDNGKTPLYIAASNGNVNIVRALINAGANLDKTGDDGKTPLYIAACRYRTDVVEELIKTNRVDLNKASNTGETPLYIAAQKGHLQVVKKLIKAGADLTKTTLNGLTARQVANRGNKGSIVRALDKAEKDKRLQREEMDAADGLTRLDPGPKKVKKRDRSELKNLNDELSKKEKVIGSRRKRKRTTITSK